MIEAVVFDLDGVLLDSEQLWTDAKRDLVGEHGGRWTEEAEHAMLGMSSPEWTRLLRDDLGVPLEADEISADVVRRIEALYERRLPVLPGADEAVRRLAARWPLGMASSSNREIIDLTLEKSGWTDLFDTTVSSEEVARGKPAPDVYLEAARRLGADPENSAAVEDAAAGIQAAAAAGLRVIAIPNPDYPPGDEALGLAAVVLESVKGLDEKVVQRL